MSDSQPLEKILSDDLKSGLKITLIDEGGELYARVSWIHWDSGFRDTGLRIEDRIVALNGVPLSLPDDPKERRLARDHMIGGLNESTLWADMGLNDGSPLEVTVLRRNLPGRGWKELAVTGSVRAERAYSTPDGRPAIAPGGPERLGRNNVGDTWSSWLERRVFEWEVILDGRWLSKFDSRRELTNHVELKPRIDAALESYPGVFSQRLAEDWALVAESLRGRKVDLPPDALEFREASDVVEAEIAAAGEAAWASFLAANEVVDELPTLDLVRDDRAPIAGRCVALPGLSWGDSVKDGDRPIFLTSHSSYHCYVAADQPSMRTFWERQADYQGRVEPRIPETYDVIGRVTPDTKLVVTPRSGAKIGLNIEVLAVRVPGHFFADVTGNAASFAGAERATAGAMGLPADDASPSDVMRAYIAAVKAGDEKSWLESYADWVAMGGEGRPLYRPFDPYRNYMSDYTRARNLMLHKVSHVEPVWESEPRLLFGELDRVPKVEQVSVLVDHIGPFDDGNYVFCTNELTRLWHLQRRDGGPWRIAARNGL